jgi:hypothetical protein
VGGDSTPVDPNIKAQSSDEIVVGLEYEILPDARAGVSYTKRYMNSIIEDMSRDEGTTYLIGNPHEGMAADFPKAVRDYDAGTLYLNKTFSGRWLAQVSYTLSSLRGNWSGLMRPETEQLDPNNNSDFDLISLLANRTGSLPGDYTHQFKAFGAKEFALSNAVNITLGVSYRARSGEAINYLGYHEIYEDGEVFLLPRGAGGRLPWVHNVDARVAFAYKLNAHNRLAFSVDVFNVFNFQQVTRIDQNYTFATSTPLLNGTVEQLENGEARSPDGTPITLASKNPNFGNATRYQPERALRFGAQFSF